MSDNLKQAAQIFADSVEFDLPRFARMAGSPGVTFTRRQRFRIWAMSIRPRWLGRLIGMVI
jgi:hypothetical protein